MTPETEKQKQIHFQNIYAAAIAAGWVWIDKFTFRSPSESTHDLSAADPAKLDSIEKEGHFKTCDTLDELMARPSTIFFDRPDPETCNKKFKHVGVAQTSEGNAVSLRQADNGDLGLCFYSPLEDGTKSEWIFGLSEEAGYGLYELLQKVYK